MERHANYALIGAITIALLIGALVFVVWLAQFQFNQTYDLYRIILRGPVSGLSRGGEVQFNGIKVGDIKNISLDPVDPNRVITDIEIEHGTPIRSDSVAELRALGITGVRFIQISPGTATRPLLREISRERPPVIAAQPSRMENFVENTTELMRSASAAVSQINRLLSDGNIATLARSLEDVGAVTAELRARKKMFGSMEGTFSRLELAAGDLQHLAGSARIVLGDKNNGTFNELAQTVAELRGTVREARNVVNQMNGPAAELSSTTMPNINGAMASIQQAADSIDRLATGIHRDPHSLIGRPRARETEIKR